MRFAVATLGCKVNQYDSAMIESRLGARGMVRCEFDEVADVYIVNTCTVTDRADAESLKLARRARRLNPRARVLMTGCLAQASPGALAAAPEIDAVIGLGRPDDLERAAPSSLAEVESRGQRLLVTETDRLQIRPVRVSIDIDPVFAGCNIRQHERAIIRHRGVRCVERETVAGHEHHTQVRSRRRVLSGIRVLLPFHLHRAPQLS